MNYYGISVTDPKLMVPLLTAEVQNYLDSSARECGYDSILHAISYRGDRNTKFAAEAEAFFVMRSAAWTSAYRYLDEVKAGTKPLPKLEDLADLMPTLSITYPTSP